MRINKKLFVRKVIGGVIFPYGFLEESNDRLGVRFSRKKERVTQFISVDYILDSYLRISFQTSAYQYPTLDGYELLCRKGEVRNPDFIKFLNPEVRLWKWEEKDQFLAILDIFKKLIVTYGMDLLNDLSVDWTDIQPTVESNKKLYENHIELNLHYREELGIKTETNAIKVMELISRKLIEIRGQDFKNIEDVLIGLAAVYGEEIVLKCGGEWQLRKDLGDICWISKIHGNMYKMEAPLNTICDYLRFGKEDVAVLLKLL